MGHVERGADPTREPAAINDEPWTWRRTVPALVTAGLGVVIVILAIRPPGLSPGAPSRVSLSPLLLGGFAVVTAIAAITSHQGRFLRMAIPAVFIGLFLVWLVATQVAEDERQDVTTVVDRMLDAEDAEALCADITPLTHTSAEMAEIRQRSIAQLRRQFTYPPPELVFEELVSRCLAG